MKAVIVAGGTPDPRDVVLLADAALVIAADAGACWLDEVGVTPDLLVGDLDAIGQALLERLLDTGVSFHSIVGGRRSATGDRYG